MKKLPLSPRRLSPFPHFTPSLPSALSSSTPRTPGHWAAGHPGRSDWRKVSVWCRRQTTPLSKPQTGGGEKTAGLETVPIKHGPDCSQSAWVWSGSALWNRQWHRPQLFSLQGCHMFVCSGAQRVNLRAPSASSGTVCTWIIKCCHRRSNETRCCCCCWRETRRRVDTHPRPHTLSLVWWSVKEASACCVATAKLL